MAVCLLYRIFWVLNAQFAVVEAFIQHYPSNLNAGLFLQWVAKPIKTNCTALRAESSFLQMGFLYFENGSLGATYAYDTRSNFGGRCCSSCRFRRILVDVICSGLEPEPRGV